MLVKRSPGNEVLRWVRPLGNGEPPPPSPQRRLCSQIRRLPPKRGAYFSSARFANANAVLMLGSWVAFVAPGRQITTTRLDFPCDPFGLDRRGNPNRDFSPTVIWRIALRLPGVCIPWNTLTRDLDIRVTCSAEIPPPLIVAAWPHSLLDARPRRTIGAGLRYLAARRQVGTLEDLLQSSVSE